MTFMLSRQIFWIPGCSPLWPWLWGCWGSQRLCLSSWERGTSDQEQLPEFTELKDGDAALTLGRHKLIVLQTVLLVI